LLIYSSKHVSLFLYQLFHFEADWNSVSKAWPRRPGGSSLPWETDPPCRLGTASTIRHTQLALGGRLVAFKTLDWKSLYSACLVFSILTFDYTFQVWIFGEKIGEGFGKTRKEAQCQAADTSLRNLAGE
jgi:hypothetical protein